MNVFRNPFGPIKQGKGGAKNFVPRSEALKGKRADLLIADDVEQNEWVGGMKGLVPIRANNAVTQVEAAQWELPGSRAVRTPARLAQLREYAQEWHAARQVVRDILELEGSLGIDLRRTGGDYLYYGNTQACCRVARRITDAGFILLGAGNFSLVFGTSGGERVYKWSIRQGDAGGYWNEVCYNSHHSNTHLPKVYDFLKFSNGMSLCQTERLVSLCGHTRARGLSDDDYFRISSAGVALSTMMHNPFSADVAEEVRSVFGMSMVMAVQRTAIWCEKNGLDADLHSDNYMFREDGTCVITDPISYTNGGEPNVHDF